MRFAVLLLSAVVVIVAGCEGPPPPPTEVSLSMAPVKTLEFRWVNGIGATHHRLLENPDGLSGFTLVDDDIGDGLYRLQAPLHQRLNAQYIIQSCNSFGCSDSATLSVNGNIRSAIGYLKARNADAYDGFGGAQGIADTGGRSLSLNADGTLLAVGASLESSASRGLDKSINPNDNSAEQSGSVYLFERQGDRWQQQAYLKASNADRSDWFGYSVSLNDAGNVLAVGAPFEASAGSLPNPNPRDNTAINAGAAYVFVRQADGHWHQQAYLKATDTAVGALFGLSLSLNAAGDRLAVGAPRQTNSTINTIGAVYLYGYSEENQWTFQRKLQEDAPQERNFGRSLSFNDDGTVLAVGGARFVMLFTGLEGDNFESTRVIVITDNYGKTVSLNGNGSLLAVTEHGDSAAGRGVYSVPLDNGDSRFSGAVYLYEPQGPTWPQPVAFLKASNSDAFDFFGTSLSMDRSGQWLAVGARGEASAAANDGALSSNILNTNLHNNDAYNAGAVYLFRRDAAGQWHEHSYLKASNAEHGDAFGASVSLSADGETLAVGASLEDGSIGLNGTDNSLPNAGAVYLY